MIWIIVNWSVFVDGLTLFHKRFASIILEDTTHHNFNLENGGENMFNRSLFAVNTGHHIMY